MGCWTRGPAIGQGSSATVSLAIAVTGGELFAVKSTELSNSSLLQKEKYLISQLSSPYIVEYRGSDITIENDGAIYNLLMEYLPGGNLSDLIKKQGGSLEESMIQLYAHQMLQGIEYLHLNGIVHCDIKGQNILVGKNGVKIADLGCARMVNSSAGDSTISGTPIFMAPEVARGEEQGFAADIWALGCTIIEMATGNSPWPEMNDPVAALYRIGYSSDVPEFPWWFSDNAKEFLSKCLKRDARERWTAKQLLQHPFFHGLINSYSRDDNGSVRNSPTSVLDQDFWDAMEVSEPSSQESSSSSHSLLSVNSPTERIKHLIGDFASSSSNLPNWTEDEGWMTVRGIPKEESQQLFQPNHNVDKDYDELMAMESFLCLFVDDEEFASSITIQDLLLNCWIDEINNAGIVSASINLIILSASVNDSFVLGILDFRNKITENLFLTLFVIFFKFQFMLNCIIKSQPKNIELGFNRTIIKIKYDLEV